MLQRFAVVDDKGPLFQWAAKSVQNDQVRFYPLEKGQTPAPGTTAVVLSGDALPNIVNGLTALGAEHEEMLYLLADAIDCREGILLGSARRVHEHAVRMARAMKLSAEEQCVLERGAILHDIGKIMLSNDVLLKNTVLSYDEWMQLQCHSKMGADLLRERKVALDIVEVVQCHHECYDGDGYPDHLERDDIPLLARAMRIIDVYCSMTSPRHYRKTHASHEQAMEHLRAERGKHFDPVLIDVFIAENVGQTVKA